MAMTDPKIEPAYVAALEAQNQLLRQLVRVSAAAFLLGACFLIVGWTRAQDSDITARVIRAKQIEIEGEKNTKLFLGRNTSGDPTIFFLGSDSKASVIIKGSDGGDPSALIAMGNEGGNSITIRSEAIASWMTLKNSEGKTMLQLFNGMFGGHVFLNGSTEKKQESIALEVKESKPTRIVVRSGNRGNVKLGDLGIDGVGMTVGNEKHVQLGASIEGSNTGFWLAEPVSGRTLANLLFAPGSGTTFNLFNSRNFRPTLLLNGETNRIESYAKDSPKVVASWPGK